VPAYRFGSSIGLTAPVVSVSDQTVTLCLNWLALDQPGGDDHVFVHLFDANMNLLAQLDTAPLAGRYPTTAWTKGEQIEDCVQVQSPQLAPGARIAFGMYDSASHDRLTIVDAAGHALDNGEIQLPLTVPPFTDLIF
jgi:hypothetical protein